MNTTIMTELPGCDLCKREGADPVEPAEYDVKTKLGPHGYLCQAHYETHGTPIGTKLIKGDASHPKEAADEADELCTKCGKGCPEGCWNKETGRYRLLEKPDMVPMMTEMGLLCEEMLGFI